MTFRSLQKHGEPVVSTAAAGGGTGGGLIQVTLKSMAAESSHKPPVGRKLPGSMTVSNVKRMCQQLFGLEMSKQKLFCQAPGIKDVWEGQSTNETGVHVARSSLLFFTLSKHSVPASHASSPVFCMMA
jgi:hypothetical protein